MKQFLLAITILTLTTMAVSAQSHDNRILVNSENDKIISLNPKQWGIIGGGSLVIFIISYFVLGMLCTGEPTTREASSTLTSGLVENIEEP